MDDLKALAAYVGLASLFAFLGTLSRSQKWFYPDDLKLPNGSPDPRAGRFNRRRMMTELSAAPALGAIVAAIGHYWGLHIIVVGGLCAGVGMIGAIVIAEVIEGAFRKRVDQFLGGQIK